MTPPAATGGTAAPPSIRLVELGTRAAPVIRRAVWSYWSVPHAHGTSMAWASEFCHLLSWLLSFRLAARLFPATTLVTDTAGAELLVKQLGLPFDQVSLSLDTLPTRLQSWWALGKLYAYREQTEPFLHIDNDVFLWPGFPAGDLAGQVVAQNPEYAPTSDTTYYRPSAFTDVVRSVGGWLPAELIDYVQHGGSTALCAGILGGLDVALIRNYADLAIRMIEHDGNQAAWGRFDSVTEHCVLAEQYLLAAVCWARGPVDVQCLFGTQQEAFYEAAAHQLGYTHLIATAKSHPRYAALLADRVRRQFPDDFETALRAQALLQQATRGRD